jgi:hypothetical protein
MEDYTAIVITTVEGDEIAIHTEGLMKFQLHEQTAVLGDEDVPNEYTRLRMPLLMPQVTDEDIYKMNLENLAIEVAGISSY